MREDNMASSSEEKYWRNFFKIKLLFYLYVIAILFELEKACIFENCILVQKNVHLVLNIRFGW